MKKWISFVLAVSLTAGISSAAFAAEKATKKDAETMVKKAVAYIKANGLEKATAEFNNPKGKFVLKDLYVSVSDLNGKCLAHGQNIKLVGKDLSELKDADGKSFYKERMEIARTKGKGWQDYKFTNPTTKTIEEKTTYFEKYQDVVVAGGVYKQ
jgi:cytochrome c